MSRLPEIHRYKTLIDMLRDRDGVQRRYENSEVLILENTEEKLDFAFLNALKFPLEAKKMGSMNGLCEFPYLLNRQGNSVNSANALTKKVSDPILLSKIVYEFHSAELKFKLLFHRIFPNYIDAAIHNTTFRLLNSINEGMHYDYFHEGAPLSDYNQGFMKIKLFWNISLRPRIWHIGPTIFDFILSYRNRLPEKLPNDINVLCRLVDTVGNLENVSKVRIEIPPNGIVFANGWTVAHEVVDGNAMVGLEGAVPASNTLRKIGENRRLSEFYSANGIKSTGDYSSFLISR